MCLECPITLKPLAAVSPAVSVTSPLSCQAHHPILPHAGPGQASSLPVQHDWNQTEALINSPFLSY